MGVIADVIQAAIDSKEYEVLFSVRVHARNVGDAIKRAALVLEYGAGAVKDVKEI
jgi:hypothetical protein